jgi:type III pantothenate kinase
MNLVIEVGNTNTKLAVFDHNKIVFKSIFLSETPFETEKISQFSIDKAIIAGSGNTEIDFRDELSANLVDFKREFIKDMHIDYKFPDKLGQDRLINARMAIHDFPDRDNLIIDIGTCITFTLVNKQRSLKGGSISPGLMMRLQALHDYTNKLPFVNILDPEFDQIIGDDTESSILSGAYLGAVYEIDSRIEEYRLKYENLNIIMTGGGTLFFHNKIKNRIFVDLDLTLRGLDHILTQL